MENPNGSLLQINFEILRDSKIRQKLLNLALMRDRSSNSHLSSHSCKRDRTERSLSKDRFTSRSPTPSKKTSNKFKDFVSKLLKSATLSKTFTAELNRNFKSLNFEFCNDNRLKVLEQELKCLRVDTTFSTYLVGLIEDLAVSMGLTSNNQIKNLRKSGNHEKKISEIISWFNITRVKAIPVTRFDLDLFKAVLTLVGKEFRTCNALEVFRSLCANPGLAVKTLKGIVDMIKKGSIDKDLVEKSCVFYQSTGKYTDVEGIQKLVQLIEELIFMFNISTKDQPVPLQPKQAEAETKSTNLQKLPKKAKESQIYAEVLPCSDYFTQKSSKAQLLNKFRSKVTKEKQNLPNQDGYCSDNTDFSENESRKKSCRSAKVEKMLIESRFNKRAEKFIKSFFEEKIKNEKFDLDKFAGNQEWIRSRFELIKGKSIGWVQELLDSAWVDDGGLDGAVAVAELKRKVFMEKFSETGYLDSVIWEIIR